MLSSFQQQGTVWPKQRAPGSEGRCEAVHTCKGHRQDVGPFWVGQEPGQKSNMSGSLFQIYGELTLAACCLETSSWGQRQEGHARWQ